MFRELRRPRGDPEVLAAQSREQYFKVITSYCLFWHLYPSFAARGDENFDFPFDILLLQLKKKLQILTLGIGGVGLASAYVSYSPEIAARSVKFLQFLFLSNK